MEIVSKLTFDKVQFDQETEAHLVIELQAPEVTIEEDKRSPLCIVPLLDVSPSMAGAKLTYAKRSIIKLIDHLSPNDYCGLVSFAGDVRVESSPVKCTADAKQDLKRKVEGLQIGNATNIADALLQGFELVSKADLPAEVINRVILFTDGMANRGSVTDSKGIVALVKANKGLASASAFGYGRDVRQDFLLDLAKVGSGNYAFVENPDDALSAFGKELGGLLSTYATNLILEVSPLKGHEITEVVSDVDVEEDALGNVTIKIPDILSEETRHLVLAVKLNPQKSAGPRAVNVFETSLGYDILDANLRKEHKQAENKTKLRFVKEGEQQASPDPELDRIVGLAQIVRAQIAAEEHARQGDYGSAVSVMNLASAAVGSRGLGDLGDIATRMSMKMADRRSYASSASYLAGFSRGVTRGVGGTYDDIVSVDLASAGVQLNTNTQKAVTEAFVAGDPDVRVGDGPPNMQPQIGGVVHPTLTVDPDWARHLQNDPTWTQTITTIDPHQIPPPPSSGYFTIGDPVELPEEETDKKEAPAPKKKLSKKAKRW